MAGVRKTNGKKGAHQKWRFWFYDWEGKRQWRTGTSSKTHTLAMARKLEEENRQIRLGYLPPPKQRRVAESVIKLVEEYLEYGRLMGGRGGRPWGPTHARMKASHLEFFQKELKLKDVDDLKGSLPKVERVLRKLSSKGRKGKTLANYAESICSFVVWLVERDYLEDDPLKKLKRVDSTPAEERRAFTPDELAKLLQVATPLRALLYSVAVSTGLRAKELASLTVGHLDVERSSFLLSASWTKNRKSGFQPVPTKLIQILAEWAEGKPKDTPLLEVPSHPARELDTDLRAAGIPKLTEEGKVDFHAFRTTFATLTVELGASVREVQGLMRHSTPQLTMNVYAKTRSERLTALVDNVGNAIGFEKSRAISVQRAQDKGEGVPANHLDTNDLRDIKNGGGGGNRTRVRKCFHEGLYVRSLSF